MHTEVVKVSSNRRHFGGLGIQQMAFIPANLITSRESVPVLQLSIQVLLARHMHQESEVLIPLRAGCVVPHLTLHLAAMPSVQSAAPASQHHSQHAWQH